MGNPSPEDKQRNADLFKDYETGDFSQVDLVSKYQISASRIYKIINREKRRT